MARVTFVARIRRRDLGGMPHTYMLIPTEALEEFGVEEGRKARFAGRIGGEAVNLARHSFPPGRKALMMGKALLKALGKKPGDDVEVTPALADPDEVDLPGELEAALAGDARARATWSTLTPGRKRTIAILMGSAKREATRLARAADTVSRLAAGEVPGPTPRRRAPEYG